MDLIHHMAEMQPLSKYVLTRCLLLACALLAGAAFLLLQAGEYRLDTALLYSYADHFQSMALIVAGAGFIGSVLLEDVLQNTV